MISGCLSIYQVSTFDWYQRLDVFLWAKTHQKRPYRGACSRLTTSLHVRSLSTIFSDDGERLVHLNHALHR